MFNGQQHGRTQSFGSSSSPNAASSTDGAFLGLGQLDASTAKQMAALNAAGMARLAQNGRSGGPTSGALLGGLSSGHDAFPFPQHTQDLAQPMARPNPQNNVLNAYKQRQAQFLHSLAVCHNGRGAPLPPALTGVPYPPNYDPHNSPWKALQLTGEVGVFRLAGRDIELFKLWNTVLSAGGGAKVSQQGLWGIVSAQFELPDSIPHQNGLQPVADMLAQYYRAIVLPFEELYRKNAQNQQQRALLAAAQAQGINPAQMQGGGMNPQAMMNNTNNSMSHVGGDSVAANSNLSPHITRQSSASAVNLSPSQAQPSHSEHNTPFDPDSESRKRKSDLEEDLKRARQRTSEPSEPLLSSVERVLPSTPITSGSQSAPKDAMNNALQQSPQGQRRKIEYVPFIREVTTSGGRDLRALMEEHMRLHGRRPLREINEWGAVDVEALTMCIRSRLPTELGYALTTLTMLSIMRGGNGAGFLVSASEDLLDELLDLIEEFGFGETEDTVDVQQETITTHKELMDSVVETGNQAFAPMADRQGAKDPKLGLKHRPGEIIVAILNILRNLSIVPDNQEYMAGQLRLLDVTLRLCGLRRSPNGELHATSPNLSLADLVAVRRDTLYVFVNVGGYARLSPLTSSSSSTLSKTSKRVARRSFELVASVLIHPYEAVPLASMVEQLGSALRPPPIADAALEVFSRIAQLDVNRQVFSKTVPQDWQRQLFVALVHRMPMLDYDYTLLREEMWLAYVQKIVMGIYTLAFMASPSLKQQLKDDKRLRLARVMARFVKRMTVDVPNNVRGFWYSPARRAVEAMKLLDDEADAFDTKQHTTGGPALSFGVGYGEGDDSIEKGTGMLGGLQDDMVWGVMLMKELEEGFFREMESLTRVG